MHLFLRGSVQLQHSDIETASDPECLLARFFGSFARPLPHWWKTGKPFPAASLKCNLQTAMDSIRSKCLWHRPFPEYLRFHWFHSVRSGHLLFQRNPERYRHIPSSTSGSYRHTGRCCSVRFCPPEWSHARLRCLVPARTCSPHQTPVLFPTSDLRQHPPGLQDTPLHQPLQGLQPD